jgi:hypothetical protein
MTLFEIADLCKVPISNNIAVIAAGGWDFNRSFWKAQFTWVAHKPSSLPGPVHTLCYHPHRVSHAGSTHLLEILDLPPELFWVPEGEPIGCH